MNAAIACSFVARGHRRGVDLAIASSSTSQRSRNSVSSTSSLDWK